MKTIIYQSLFCLAFSLLANAVKTQSTITGRAADEKGPLPFANVLLLQLPDTTLVKGEVTENDGAFSIRNIDAGNYLVAIGMVGYEDTYQAVLVPDNGQVDMGQITVAENVSQLTAVTVKAKKPLFEQKIDRMVVNVANSVTSAGSNALEVLERSPGVSIDRMNGAISMAGKNGVVVMINGKISRMSSDAIVQMLEGMNADNIERIELITTPPANFEAQGNAGFIQIILKKTADEGTNGSFALTAGYGNHEKFGGSINLNHRKNRVNLYGDYSYNYNRSLQEFINGRTVVFQDVLTGNRSVSDRDPTLTQNHNLRMGIDYELSEKTVLGALATWSRRDWTMDALNDIRLTEAGLPSGRQEMTIDEDNLWNNYLGNINLKHQFTEKQSLNVDLDYAYYHQDQPSEYDITYFDGNDDPVREEQLRSGKETPIRFVVGKADYAHELGNKVKLETGLKGAFSNFDNDISLEKRGQQGWVVEPDFTAEYTLNEDILAAYAAFIFQLDEKTDLKFGLRYEHTESNLGSREQPDIVDRSYGNFFPSFFLSREINENNRLQFSYSRRIDRPSFTYLAPFIFFSDPTTYNTGNIALQPSITDAVKADYRYRTILFSLQYSFEDEAITRSLPSIDPITNQQVNSAENLDYSKVLSASVSLPVEVANWWQMQYNIMGFWQQDRTRFEGSFLTTEQKSYTINSVQTFTLPLDFTLEVSGNFRSPGVRGFVRRKANGVMNAGLQKKLGGNNGRLSVNVNDVLRTLNYELYTTDPSLGFTYEGAYLFSERAVRVTYSRSFGNNKLKGNRRRQTGSSEEQQRVN